MLEHIDTIKRIIIGGSGIMGAVLSSIFGTWNEALTLLCVLMLVDFISGLILAGVFGNSPKTTTGGLSSATGWKGVCKKIMTLAIVIVGHYLDMAMGIDYIRNAVIYAFAANELISIIENAGLMNLHVPKMLKNAIDLLKEKADEDEPEKTEEVK